MAALVAPITALLLSSTIFLVGMGLLGTLLPLRAEIEGFAPVVIGFMGSAYFAGFVAGCLIWPYGIRRVGHIRAFAIACAIFASAVLVHVLLVEPVVWIGLRILVGGCAAGLYMVIESWLNEHATNESRGQVFSLYTALNFSGLVLGQILLTTAPPTSIALFLVISMALSWSIVPVALTKTVQPAPPSAVRVRIRRLYALSPVGVVGCFLVGFCNSCFWTLGPAAMKGYGFGVSAIAAFMAVTILGGAIMQVPLGRISDRFDRRLVLVATMTGTALVAGGLVTGLTIAGAGEIGMTPLLVGGFLLGSTALTGYALCIAHVNDQVSRGGFVEASSGLLLAYGAGAAMGPVTAGLVGEIAGHASPFAVMAASSLTLAGFALWRIAARKAVPPEERTGFVAVARTSPEAFGLDPRAAEETAGEPAAQEELPARRAASA
ncbi:MAG: MFS transporter [Alphaproteobacteria bacterium]|nr:MFS transporter [Alphaproteobacteria bacterium]